MKFFLSKTGQTEKTLFRLFSFILLSCIAVAIYTEKVIFIGIPVLLIGLAAVFKDYRPVYFLLLLSLPFSTEISLPGGFSLYLFSEPILLILTLCWLGSWVQGSFWEDLPYLRHPFILLLFLFLGWGLFCSLFSVDKLKSFKYLLAQLCYIGVFISLTASLVKRETTIEKIWKYFLLALTVSVLFVLGKHLSAGFSFDRVNWAVQPFFLNHVVYAVTAAYSLPLGLFLYFQNKNITEKWLWLGVVLALVLAIIFSYTRATWLCLPLLVFYTLALKKRLLRLLIIIAFIAASISITYLVTGHRFMQYSPDYEKTIFNQHNLQKHLQAAYKMEDVSGMERIYRWVAAGYMIADKPFTGSGPSTFYPEYKKYTVKSFRTYVSGNPEKSTAHNFLLLQTAEQGVAGGLLLLLVLTYLLLWPERLYHQTQNKKYKALLLAISGCLFVIIFHLLVNELLALDKIGSFFFISAGMLLKLDYWIKEEVAQAPEV